MTALRRWWQQALCAHLPVTRTEGGRYGLTCYLCGADIGRGWDVAPAASGAAPVPRRARWLEAHRPQDTAQLVSRWWAAPKRRGVR